MIPDLEDGVLPEGVHICSIDEVERAFGRFQRTDRRQHLTATLRRYVEAARQAGTAQAIIIDGSYVTVKDEPGDIDVMLVLKLEADLTEDLLPSEYNVQSKRMVKKLYGFDIFTAVEGGEIYQRTIRFLSNVNPGESIPYTSKPRKGILRIEL